MPQHVLRGLHPVCPRGTCATAPFASARPTRIASFDSWIAVIRPLLCLSTSYADCIPHASATPAGAPTLPQHVLRGLHRGSGISALQMLIFASARPTRIASVWLWMYHIIDMLCLSTSYADCIGKNAQGKAGVYDGRCCESVDSFSIIEER